MPADRVDERLVYRPDRSWPVWVTLTFPNGEPDQTTDGFAVAWTREYVLVQVRWQVEYYLGTRSFWVEAGKVSRRRIEPSRRGPNPEQQAYARPQRDWRRVE